MGSGSEFRSQKCFIQLHLSSLETVFFCVYNWVVVTSSFSIATLPESKRVDSVIPSPQDQLQFQPGDVAAWLLHGKYGSTDNSDYDNGVVALSNGSHTSELVWFAIVDITATQTSQSCSCSYPVGTNGVLNSSTRAAPVILISVVATLCPQILFTSVTTSLNFALYPTLALTDHEFEDPLGSSSTNHYLVWISVAVVVVAILFTTVATTVICCIKHHRKGMPI